MTPFVSLGAERCILAKDVIGISSVGKMNSANFSSNAVIHDLCAGAAPKTAVFCRNNTVFLTTFTFKAIKARLLLALGEKVEDEELDGDEE